MFLFTHTISCFIFFDREILEYKKEFFENGDSMDGTAGLGDMETFYELSI